MIKCIQIYANSNIISRKANNSKNETNQHRMTTTTLTSAAVQPSTCDVYKITQHRYATVSIYDTSSPIETEFNDIHTQRESILSLCRRLEPI